MSDESMGDSALFIGVLIFHWIAGFAFGLGGLIGSNWMLLAASGIAWMFAGLIFIGGSIAGYWGEDD